MCNLVAVNTIIEILEQTIIDEKVFTAFDITKEVRTKTNDKVTHNDVRKIVNNEFITQQMAKYDRELCTLNLSGSPQALVYFPDTKHANYHSLVDSSTIIDIDDDNTDLDNLLDDEYKLTAEGRINISKKLISQVTPNAGTYDIIVNGSLVCGSLNKDGRIRVSLKHIGISNNKVKVTADISNNTIKIKTI